MVEGVRLAPSGPPTRASSSRREPSPDAPPPFVGTILFTQDGNLWSMEDEEVKQLTNGGTDAMPNWLPDGSGVILVETRHRDSKIPYGGVLSDYVLDYPVLVRVSPDGSTREDVKSGLYKLTGGTNRYYFTWLLQPDVSPDGKTIALVSDAPDPFDDDVEAEPAVDQGRQDRRSRRARERRARS